MKRAIHIIAALTLLASGLGALMWGRGHDITGSLLWLLAAILCFAPVIPAIELSIGARIKQPVKYGIILALIISGWVLAAYAAGDNGPNGLSDEMTELMAWILLFIFLPGTGIILLLSGLLLVRKFLHYGPPPPVHNRQVDTDNAASYYMAPDPVAEQAQIARVQNISGRESVADEIRKLRDLYDSGDISLEDYNRQKARLLQ